MTTRRLNDTGAETTTLGAELDDGHHQRKAPHEQPRRRSWWRSTLVVTLVLLTCVSVVAGVVGVWARRNFLSTGRFVDRVGPLIEEPAVQDALTARLTDQIMTLIDPRGLFEEVLPERGQLLAVPLTNAVEGFVQDRVHSFIRSDAFARLWVVTVTVAHEQAVDVLKGRSDVVKAGKDQVQLNLVPVVDAVLKRLTAASPQIFGHEVNLPDISVEDVPDEAIARLNRALGVQLDRGFGQFTVYDKGRLGAAQQAVKLFDRYVVPLLVVGLALGGLALWLSPRRRRTLLQLSTGLAIGMVLIRRVSFRVHDEIASLPPTALGRRATSLTAEQFLHPLTTFALWVLLVVAVVAAAAVLSGTYPWVVSVRRRTAALWTRAVPATGDIAADDTAVVWVRAHRDGLLACGVLAGLVVLWSASLSWAGLLLVLGLVGGFEAAVYRVGAPTQPS